MDLKKLRELAEAIVKSDTEYGYTQENIRAYRDMQGYLTGAVLLELVRKAEMIEDLRNLHKNHLTVNPDNTTYSGCRTCNTSWPCEGYKMLFPIYAEPLAQWEIDLMRGTND